VSHFAWNSCVTEYLYFTGLPVTITTVIQTTTQICPSAFIRLDDKQIEPGGEPSIISAFICFRGKMKRGRMNVPVAFMQTTTVTNWPRSREVKQPTCRLSFIANTFLHCGNSCFVYIVDILRWKLVIVGHSFFRTRKNCRTVSRLNPRGTFRS